MRYIFFLILFSSLQSQAQIVQWASKVIEFSSELTPVQYSAQQTIGKPNVLPAGGQSPSAWSPDMPKRKEFITLGYANPISIRQIAIAESHNPSGISKVFAYDESGKEYLIQTLNPVVVPLKGRMLNIFMEPTPYKVAAVKIEFDGSALNDYFGIDAVAICDSNYPIIADIPTMQLLASGVLIESLDKNVNSDYKELNPVLSPDGKTLYFSRSNHPENVGGVNDNEDIWFSELDSDGKWKLAQNMGPQFNDAATNSLNSIQAVTPDGKSAIMLIGNKYLAEGKLSGGVSISTNTSGTWSKPIPLKIRNDYNLSEKANFFLANNRRTILLAVQRKDSKGDRDIYVSFANNDSTWSEPLNLGEIVNSAAEESAPFLDNDGKTLYYSSKGFSGYGGSDIYVTRRLDDTWTNWSDPENLGPTINSPLEDLFFNIPLKSDFAYYSRGVSEHNTDIFRVRLPILKTSEPWITVTGKVTDKLTGRPVEARIVYEKFPERRQLGVAKSNPETGVYEIEFIAGNMYQVKVEAQNKLAELKKIDLKKIEANRVLQNHDFALESVPGTEDGLLNPIFFENNRASLTNQSLAELKILINILRNKPSAEVEVSGHSDGAGSESKNLKISEQRAIAVQSYLRQQGIASERIHIVFFGAKKPLSSNDTEEGRGKNRRVDFKLLNL